MEIASFFRWNTTAGRWEINSPARHDLDNMIEIAKLLTKAGIRPAPVEDDSGIKKT